MLASALTIAESEICPGCGHPLHESTDPLNDPHDPEGSGKYVAMNPVRCYACTVVDEKAKKYEKSTAPRALRFGSVLRPRQVPGGRVAGQR